MTKLFYDLSRFDTKSELKRIYFIQQKKPKEILSALDNLYGLLKFEFLESIYFFMILEDWILPSVNFNVRM